jgi:hypothetical protein
MTVEAVATDWALSDVAAERREQGLPPTITDPRALAAVARLVNQEEVPVTLTPAERV